MKVNYGQLLRFLVANVDKAQIIFAQAAAIAAAKGAVPRWNAIKVLGDTLAPLADELEAVFGVDILVAAAERGELKAQVAERFFGGDGKRLEKLLDTLLEVLPILLPIFLKK